LVMVICGIGMVGGALACGILLGSPVLGNLLPGLPQLTLVLSGTAGVGMARNPNGFVLEIRDRWAPLWRRIPAAAAVGAALVGVWVLRRAGVITNWPYAIVSIAILALAPAFALERPVRRRAIEWAGLTRPFSPDELIEIDRAVGVPDLDIHAPA